MKRLMRLSRVWMASAAVGGSALVLQGCDPGVRDTVITGVQDASTGLLTSFVNAFFESLSNDGSNDPNAPATI